MKFVIAALAVTYVVGQSFDFDDQTSAAEEAARDAKADREAKMIAEEEAAEAARQAENLAAKAEAEARAAADEASGVISEKDEDKATADMLAAIAAAEAAFMDQFEGSPDEAAEQWQLMVQCEAWQAQGAKFLMENQGYYYREKRYAEWLGQDFCDQFCLENIYFGEVDYPMGSIDGESCLDQLQDFDWEKDFEGDNQDSEDRRDRGEDWDSEDRRDRGEDWDSEHRRDISEDQIRQMRREIFDRKVSYYFDEADKNLDGELGFKDFAYLLDYVNGEKDSGYEDYILEDAMYSVNSMDSRFDGVLKGPVSFMSFRSFVSNVSGFARLDK